MAATHPTHRRGGAAAAVAIAGVSQAAGITKGDVITAVDGAALATPEELRRKLRDAVATKGEAVLAVRRREKTETVRVTFPDP